MTGPGRPEVAILIALSINPPAVPGSTRKLATAPSSSTPRARSAAVSQAGGFGVLGAVGFSPEQLAIELKWIDEHVGDKPYGVDLIIPAKYAGDDEGGYEMADLVKANHYEALAVVIETCEAIGVQTSEKLEIRKAEIVVE